MRKSWFLLIMVLVCLQFSCSSNSATPSQQTASISPTAAAVGLGQSVQFQATLPSGTSSVTWSVNGTAGGNSDVGMIDGNGNYTAPDDSQSMTVQITASGGSSASVSAEVYVVAPGTVEPTQNPQVALYTIAPPAAANVSVQFGPTTSYGLSTWQQGAPSGGGPVSILVAGMTMNATYHMQATVQFGGGVNFADSDHTFTTGSLPAGTFPTFTTTTTAGMTPQSGVELLNLIAAGTTTINAFTVATDLSGNVLWGYNPGASLPAGDFPDPIKLLPNGHFLINYSGTSPDGVNSLMQEVDLTGQVYWQMSAAQLNQELAAATCAGCNITVIGTHHDFAVLPNGHLIIIAAEQQTITNYGLVTGDVLIDLDQNRTPVWVWSTFDHLDVSRQPMGFPDWTHSNAIVYSPSDKDLILSMRHQDWVIKIDYNDGQGTGNIVWKLGYQGDFTLENGTDPIDWFYAQHDANVISTNSSGTFQMTMFDNGNNRVLDTNGDICGTTTACYSRVPIIQVDESAMTATLEWVDNLSPLYSFFGGSSRLLANGDIEFAECAPLTPVGSHAMIYEVTQSSPPQTVWSMTNTTSYIYRGFRIPSLYPGVQW